ncbi:MAG: glycoside hydrolase family 26 protein, partial [Actinomycetota bacterium]|nr:glycoside hydrolase family 26 protein [Actinomycetota bacterium]
MVLKRMSDTGRTFDGVGSAIDGLTVGGVTSERWIKSIGSFPFIHWSPKASVANVAAGLDDAELVAVANRLKTLGSLVMLRMWHEFNGNWFPWSATLNTCSTWTRGWRHVVDVFRQHGATNVGFAWSPSEGQNRAIRDACYPGNSYVDWVSPDGYNQCLT